MSRKLVKRVIKAAGGPAKLAQRISERARLRGKPREAISLQAVSQWTHIPVEPVNRVPDVEAITGIPRHELRPDIYDPPQSAPEARP